MNAIHPHVATGTYKHALKRRGIGQVEIIVAALLMGLLTGLLSTVSYQIKRVHKDAQNYQVAVYELTNQLRHLQTIPKEQVTTEITNLKLSEVATNRLENAILKGQLTSDGMGTRIDVEIQWNRIGTAEPVRMSMWLDTVAASTPLPISTESAGQP